MGGYNATRSVEVYNYRYEPTRGVSWIKIKKSKQKTSLSSEFVDVSIEGVSGINFFLFCCKFSKKFFFYRPVNTDKPNFVSFLVFVGAAASFIAKISSF